MSPKRRCDDKPLGRLLDNWLSPFAGFLLGAAISWGVMSERMDNLSKRDAVLTEWLQRVQATVNNMREQCAGNTATIEAIIRGGSM